MGLQLADYLSAREAEGAAEGHEGRSHRALRQLDREQVQSGSDEGRPVGRSDVGRDDDRLLLDRHRSAGQVNATATVETFEVGHYARDPGLRVTSSASACSRRRTAS